MPPVCRVLPFLTAPGAAQMAADEALLESAQAGTASFRCYAWSEVTLSLGYFQPAELRLTDPRLAGLPFVRRPTGGHALVHHHELTYALALPAGAPWQDRESWACRMHRIIAAALTRFGVTAPACAAEPEARFAGLLCFQHQTPGDLVLAGGKVVGSAQRRQRGALLQHGSILLAASPFTPELPGVRELAGKDVPVAVLSEALVEELRRGTGWELRADDWRDAELARRKELTAGKYEREAWNGKR
jgi:lipoate-protein ligase A